MKSLDDETGPRPQVVDYETLIAEERRAGRGDLVERRANAARLAEIADNLRTLRERADEQAKRAPPDT